MDTLKLPLKISILAVFSIYALFFSEWIFFVTKPSMLSVAPYFSRLSVLFVSPVPFALSIFALLFGVSFLLIRFNERLHCLVIYLTSLVTAAVITIIAMLLIDNFTYVLFEFNIASTQGYSRYLYLFVWLGLFILIYRKLVILIKSDFLQDNFAKLVSIILVVVSISFLIGVVSYEAPKQNYSRSGNNESGNENKKARPNIIYFSTDGLNADHLSLYGYSRETTPYITSRADEFLIAENAFANSSASGGSLGSMFSGKHPLTTRVVYPPDIFTGTDAYQHFAGVIRNLGYRSMQVGSRHYADAFDLNLRNGFDTVNYRSMSEVQESFFVPEWMQQVWPTESFFMVQVSERVSSRILHLFGIKDAVNPYQLIKNLNKPTAVGGLPHDKKAIDQLINLIDESDRPVFAFIYMTGTHGPFFKPGIRNFSKGLDINKDTNKLDDFYDDAILDFDRYVSRVMDHLSEIGALDNTIIVINSDHSRTWTTDKRLPLLIRFPGKEYAGVIKENVQYLDIAPTILDYLGEEIPKWMDGDSLISNTIKKVRPVISVGNIQKLKRENGLLLVVPEPPFYSLGDMSFTICDRRYTLYPAKNTFTKKTISGHTDPCAENELATDREIRAEMNEYLKNKGYDISSLYFITVSEIERDPVNNSTVMKIIKTLKPRVGVTLNLNGGDIIGVQRVVQAKAVGTNGINRLVIGFDGIEQGSMLCNAPYHCALDATDIPNGPHNITAFLIDNSARLWSTTVPVVVNTAVDLSVFMDSPRDLVAVNEVMTYTISVNNLGSGTATGVSFIDRLPQGLAFDSITASQGSCKATVSKDKNPVADISCDLGDVAGSDSKVIVALKVIPTAVTKLLTNTVSVRANESDDATNNTAKVTASVKEKYSLSMNMSGSSNSVNVNAVLVYKIDVKNKGIEELTGVTLIDVLSSDVTYKNVTMYGGGKCNAAPVKMKKKKAEGATTKIVCKFDTLLPGASKHMFLQVVPKIPGDLTSTFSVTAEEISGEESATVVTTVQ